MYPLVSSSKIMKHGSNGIRVLSLSILYKSSYFLTFSSFSFHFPSKKIGSTSPAVRELQLSVGPLALGRLKASLDRDCCGTRPRNRSGEDDRSRGGDGTSGSDGCLYGKIMGIGYGIYRIFRRRI